MNALFSFHTLLQFTISYTTLLSLASRMWVINTAFIPEWLLGQFVHCQLGSLWLSLRLPFLFRIVILFLLCFSDASDPVLLFCLKAISDSSNTFSFFKKKKVIKIKVLLVFPLQQNKKLSQIRLGGRIQGTTK